MTGSAADRLVEDYLARLDEALDGLPADRAEELVDELDAHIAQARAELPGGGSEAELMTLLDRLGAPEEIARDALEQEPQAAAAPAAPAPRRNGWIDGFAVVLLPIGGLVIPVIGWFAGVALLWISDSWTVRDKLIGTFLPPGGYMFIAYLAVAGGDSGTCSGAYDERGRVIYDTCADGGDGSGLVDVLVISGVVALLAMPLATMIYLLLRRRRQQQQLSVA